ncbi:uncharacterized protein LOC143219700 [Lasioglossum baleicum]|uniref:uncharacterized protein LOC143219700 n=1 Tax=Lasioglossum baleicum TaxID=434251 RepID=UPI003FCE7488
MGLARVASAYKTVPVDTLCVLTGIPPWDLKAEERKLLFNLENRIMNFRHETSVRDRMTLTRRRRQWTEDESEEDEEEVRTTLEEYIDWRNIQGDLATGEDETTERKKIKKELKEAAKKRALVKWQEKWDGATVGRITHEIIPNIQEWTDRNHGDLDFYVTQALTGHGVFNTFRQRIGRTQNAACWYHPGVVDDPEHTFVLCQQWEEERCRLLDTLGSIERELSMKKIVKEMLRNDRNWRSARGFFKAILEKKEKEERKREKESREEEEQEERS